MPLSHQELASKICNDRARQTLKRYETAADRAQNIVNVDCFQLQSGRHSMEMRKTEVLIELFCVLLSLHVITICHAKD